MIKRVTRNTFKGVDICRETSEMKSDSQKVASLFKMGIALKGKNSLPLEAIFPIREVSYSMEKHKVNSL